MLSKHLRKCLILVSGVVMLCMLAPLIGCKATHVAIKKRNLDLQTKMSASIFLDPITVDKRTVFLQIRNTSDKPELDITRSIGEAMLQKGYQVLSIPDDAHYWLQVNILQVGRSDLRAANHALNRGFGSALTGAMGGAAVGGLAPKGKRQKTATIGSMVGATVSLVTDAMVEDVVYSVIVDVQISERIGNSVVVKEKTHSRLKQGTKGVVEVTSTAKIDWKRYQTRVVSTANKANLNFSSAAPALIQGLTHSITGLF